MTKGQVQGRFGSGWTAARESCSMCPVMEESFKEPLEIKSLQNPRIKHIVKLRKRSARDEEGVMIIEGYRELVRALDNGVQPTALFYSEPHFQGSNEPALIQRCRGAGAELFACAESVFTKVAYRDRPEGLLALAPQLNVKLTELHLPPHPLVIVAETIEKPGNLGTILRSADATGVDAVIICDRCTDIHNPNVIRASIGTIFSLPIIDCTTDEALAWLKENKITTIATTPDTTTRYTETDLTLGCAIVVGSEQYGLSDQWLGRADVKVRIPMLGQCDSLNVASATTLMLYEAVRQRGC